MYVIKIDLTKKEYLINHFTIFSASFIGSTEALLDDGTGDIMRER